MFEFDIKVRRDIAAQSEEELIRTFKLTSKFSENLTLWTEEGKIKVFNDTSEIVEHFVKFRITKYAHRLAALIDLKSQEAEWLTNKLNFIKYWLDNAKRLTGLTKVDLFADLEAKGFVDIDRLLSNKIYNLTKDEVAKLESEIADLVEQIKVLKTTAPEALYRKELEQLRKDLKDA